MGKGNRLVQSQWKKRLTILTLIGTFLLTGSLAEAQKKRRKASSQSSRNPAQFQVDSDAEEDVFDPFADFSEFESSRDEEEDLNFFRNGRLLTLGFQGGMLNYTNEMAEKYQPSFRYGVFLSYFFDLNFALQLNWLTTDSPASFRSPETNLTGNSSLSNLGFSIKYFLNTQNVTKGLADLNPYFLIGMGSYNRRVRFDAIEGTLTDSAMGFSGGMGIELPLLRKRLFWGAQITYDLVNFKDENIPFIYDNRNYGTSRGDLWNLTGSIGINF